MQPKIEPNNIGVSVQMCVCVCVCVCAYVGEFLVLCF